MNRRFCIKKLPALSGIFFIRIKIMKFARSLQILNNSISVIGKEMLAYPRLKNLTKSI